MRKKCLTVAVLKLVSNRVPGWRTGEENREDDFWKVDVRQDNLLDDFLKMDSGQDDFSKIFRRFFEDFSRIFRCFFEDVSMIF